MDRGGTVQYYSNTPMLEFLLGEIPCVFWKGFSASLHKMLGVRVLQGRSLPGVGGAGGRVLGGSVRARLGSQGLSYHPARSRAVRGSPQPGQWAPPWGRCWAEARPGRGPAGGGPCLGRRCPQQAQLWLWYSGSCGADGGRGVEDRVKAAPRGKGVSPRHCPEPLQKHQEEGAAQLCCLQVGPEHRQPSLQEGDDLRALTKVFLLGNKEQRQHIHGCCISSFSAL